MVHLRWSQLVLPCLSVLRQEYLDALNFKKKNKKHQKTPS